MSTPADLHEAAQHWARAHLDPSAQVTACTRMPGHSSGTYGLDVRTDAGPDRLVLRLPPSASAGQAGALLRQVRLLDVLNAHGLPVPAVRFSGADPSWFGAPYTVVTRMPGATLGDVLADPDPVPADRHALYGQAVEVLAAVHAIDAGRHLACWGERLSLDAVLDRWDRMVPRYATPDPAAECLRRLRKHIPRDTGPDRLVHGDYYSNNWPFERSRLTAVLDREAAHVGPLGADLGWLVMMHDPQGWDPPRRPDLPVSPSPAELLARYERTAGSPVDHLDWFRALAGLRLAALTSYFLTRHRSGERPDPVWERIGRSVPRMLERAVELA